MLTWQSKRRTAACKQAAGHLKPRDCLGVRRGRVLSRRTLLRRPGVWPVVYWKRASLFLIKDGTLMLLVGEVARQVRVNRTQLEQVFTLHRRARWWMQDPGYGMVPDQPCVLYDREAYPGGLGADGCEYLKHLGAMHPTGEPTILEWMLDDCRTMEAQGRP